MTDGEPDRINHSDREAHGSSVWGPACWFWKDEGHINLHNDLEWLSIQQGWPVDPLHHRLLSSVHKHSIAADDFNARHLAIFPNDSIQVHDALNSRTLGRSRIDGVDLRNQTRKTCSSGTLSEY